MSFLNLIFLYFYRTLIRRDQPIEEGCVSNERIPPPVDHVPIVGLEDENEEVPLQEPHVPLEPHEPQVPMCLICLMLLFLKKI